MPRRVVVIGPKRSGKDTVCGLLGSPYKSTSQVFAPRAVKRFADHGLCQYRSVQACFDDRGQHRQQWFDWIRAYTKVNPARLGREVFRTVDVLCGCRSRFELAVIRAKFPDALVVWVDASTRVPPTAEAMDVTAQDADVTVNNNGTLSETRQQLEFMCLTAAS